ncbi:uncharacterized protein N7469_003294 [Penicillium citrinum]|uniref:pyridoxal 5'-phosphate synthase n=1 Tax=Penicillium citrinum TaxID=5077 RepID=A0A9W9TPF9_PENCI|nr:uncharacterized protein N7469_003294 [Penicillium citrinum]KAJ5234126.1 hypothetical protein N7469_003294 [Penicillium citrinum]KAK5801329.1 hypothetical protein VI817_003541 [Penicillium citrinum]
MTESFRTELRRTKVLEGPFLDLNINTLPSTPHETFKAWFHEAVELGVREPHAMTVSTVDEEGYPDARVLILKNVDERGWHFAIKADSPKGKQLTKTGRAALTFYWPDLARQIRIKGKAAPLPDEESAQDYKDRPVESRISAIASRQSEVLPGPEILQESLAKTADLLKEDPFAGVTKWRVYAVAPEMVEFWQGDSSRLHKRVQFQQTKEGNWQKQMLWP